MTRLAYSAKRISNENRYIKYQTGRYDSVCIGNKCDARFFSDHKKPYLVVTLCKKCLTKLDSKPMKKLQDARMTQVDESVDIVYRRIKGI